MPAVIYIWSRQDVTITLYFMTSFLLFSLLLPPLLTQGDNEQISLLNWILYLYTTQNSIVFTFVRAALQPTGLYIYQYKISANSYWISPLLRTQIIDANFRGCTSEDRSIPHSILQIYLSSSICWEDGDTFAKYNEDWMSLALYEKFRTHLCRMFERNWHQR